jgi:hypothetical protein
MDDQASSMRECYVLGCGVKRCCTVQRYFAFHQSAKRGDEREQIVRSAHVSQLNMLGYVIAYVIICTSRDVKLARPVFPRPTALWRT